MLFGTTRKRLPKKSYRTLSDYLRGKQYEAEKQRQGAPEGNRNRKIQSAQNEQFEKSRKEIKSGTAGRIGKEYGVDGATIRRDANFAVGLDTAEQMKTV